MAKNSSTEPSAKQIESFARVVQSVVEGDYISRWKMIRINFTRGIAFGFGSFVGASVVAVLVLWILSWFSDVPFINDISENIQNTLN